MRIGIAGLGLIGGSVGLALREPGREIIGFEPLAANASVAKDRFCVDRLVSLEEVAQADVVFVAAPPRFAVDTLDRLRALKRPETVLTDCTSVKMPVAEWAMATKEPMFVPGHPMAGHERSGPGFASAWMFRNARWLLAPLEFTRKGAVREIEKLVRAMGASPIHISAESHDRHVAVVSHLPHALAASLVLLAESLERQDVGGGSWRDVTRVGGVDPELWTQIFLGNSVELSAALAELAKDLDQLSRDLASGDEAAVKAVFVAAAAAKAKQLAAHPEPPPKDSAARK